MPLGLTTLVLLLVAASACGSGENAATTSTLTAATTTDLATLDCTPLPWDLVAQLLGNPEHPNYVGDGVWMGDGEFIPTAAFFTPIVDPAGLFKSVIYLQGDTPDIDGQVFVFASGEIVGEDFLGLTVGADAVTREFWVWGTDTDPNSTAGQAAAAAAASAEGIEALETACR